MFLSKKVYHVEVWLWICFAIVIFCVLFYLYLQNAAPKIEKTFNSLSSSQKIELQDVLETAQNGDIILMSGDTRGERTCRWCAGTIFSHAGFLFREVHPKTKKDILYILDCDIGQSSKDGVRLMPLREKLHRYQGLRIAALKRLKSSPHKQAPHTSQIVNLIPKYLPLEFDSSILTWWVADRGSLDGGWLYSRLKNPKKIFCSELVASVLMDLGIMKKDRVPACYSPGDLDSRLRLEEGYHYSPTQYFQFPKKSMEEIMERSQSTAEGFDLREKQLLSEQVENLLRKS